MSVMVGIYSDANWLEPIPISRNSSNHEIPPFFHLLTLGISEHHSCLVYLRP